MTTHVSANFLTQVNFLDEPVQSPVEDLHEGLLGLPHLSSVLQILKVYHVRNCSPILNGMPPAKEYGLLYTGLYIFSIPAGNHGYLWPLRSVNGGMDRSNRIITVTNGPFCNGS